MNLVPTDMRLTAPDPLTSHGVNVRPLGNDRFRVYGANHGDRKSLEVVDVEVLKGRLRATWRRCIPVSPQLGIWPNAVAPLPDGGLILAGNNVATWRPGGRWEKFEGYTTTRPSTQGDFGLANGIEVSRDGEAVFISEPEAGLVRRIPRREDAKESSVRFNFHPDNLRWGEGGYLYVAGPYFAEGFPVKQCYAAPLCDIGFGVARIDPETFEAQEIYHSGDYGMRGRFGAATSVQQIGRSLWVGTVHGDRIAILPLNSGRAERSD